MGNGKEFRIEKLKVREKIGMVKKIGKRKVNYGKQEKSDFLPKFRSRVACRRSRPNTLLAYLFILPD